MSFDVLVTGGSSPLGDHVVPRLLDSGRRVAATARSKEAAARLRSRGVHVIEHTLGSGTEIAGVEATALVHLAGIRFVGDVLRLAPATRARRVVVISSASATAPGHPQRDEICAAEDDLATLGADARILRPTMIYGSARDNNVRRLYHTILRLPAVPHFSGGGAIMPVLVDDVVEAVLESLEEPTPPRTRPVAGPAPVRIGDLVDAICESTGSRRLSIHLPVGMAARVTQRAVKNPGKLVHAVQMLTSDRVVDDPRTVGFHYPPTPLSVGIVTAIRRYARADFSVQA